MAVGKDASVTRREVLQAGLLTGVGAALPSLLAAQSKLPVIYKTIPATGQKIPVIGLGTDQLGPADYPVVRDVLKRMHELGGAVIDTAARYGTSETNIGKALAELGLRDKMFVATKFNAPGVDPIRELPSGRESIELSFQRLHKVDLMFIHMMKSVESMMPLLQELKQQGRVRYIGITNVTAPGEHPRLVEYLRKYPLDFVQLSYSIGDRLVEQEVLPLAQERKIAVMVAHPLGRNTLWQQASKRQLPGWAADFNIKTWGQYFLKYVVSHPAVTCAVPGTSKLVHLEDNLMAGLGELPDAAARRKMQDFWDGAA